ncbi:T9SS type A sorting domain-containing protein [Pontibacter ruber]|uniref:T9SS type A sorting domain-containing protein n=1 Tax=Pontibacter ruber TaxID=1343895 RepID=A0ABW5CYA4_9BACT|nr:T9SS type A sorting domain-containing protein [Pontibacter ruber]
MKHFYNFNFAASVQPVTSALGRAAGSRLRNFLTLTLLSLFMLLGVEVFGQAATKIGVGANVTAKTSLDDTPLDWNLASSWVEGVVPISSDIVFIPKGSVIKVTGNAVCNRLDIDAGSGQDKRGGEIIIGDDNVPAGTTSTLTVANLRFKTTTGKPKLRANLTIQSSGHLVVTDAITKHSQNGGAVSDANTNIFYTFSDKSIIEYSGANQTLFNFSAETYSVKGEPEQTSSVYQNLILSGSGTKTPTDAFRIEDNLTINSGTIFAAGSLVHNISGSVTNSGNLLAGTSTINIGGDFTNTGTGAFNKGTGSTIVFNGSNQSVAGVNYHNLQFTTSGTKTATGNIGVAGAFTDNTGSIFAAASYTHTISGNWNIQGAFTPGSSTIVLNGSSGVVKNISAAAGARTFNNLTIQNGEGTLLNNFSVTGILDLKTKLKTQGFTLDLGTTGVLARAENNIEYIDGFVKATRNIPAYGTGTQLFGNIGLSIGSTSSTSVEPMTLIITRTTGKELLADNGYSSARRYYDITAASGTSIEKANLQVDMDFMVSELNQPSSPQSIYRQTSVTAASSTFQGIISTLFKSTGETTTGVTQTYRISNFGTLGLYTAGSMNAPLPVELAWFKAERQAQGVNLTWMTASEKDNSGFEVQVSTDGRNFSKIGFVKSSVTTSSVAQRYSFLDKNIATGTRYYRLAQIDLDGTTTYSFVKAINVGGIKVATAAYPNPFASDVTVQLSNGTPREVRIILSNAFGQVISEQQSEATESGQVTVNMSSAKASGIYILQVVDNGSKHTFKLMKK